MPTKSVKDNKELYQYLQDYAKKDKDIYFTEKGDTFERAIPCPKLKNHPIHPTTDKGHYASQLDLSKDLRGFYTGDPNEWIPVLLRDQFLPSDGELCIAELEFPEKTPVIKGKRPVTLADSNDFMDEFFVIHDQPVIPKSIRKLTDSEYNEYEQQANEFLNEEDRWANGEEDENLE